MDGVLCDFVTAFLARAGKADPYPNNPGRWDIFNLVGLTWEEGFALISDQRFWETLSWHDEGTHFVQSCEAAVGQENVYILSSPAKCPGAAAGKMEWLATWLPDYLDRLVLTRHKEKLAAPNRILVDDYAKNVIKFEEAGGLCVQVPRPWNPLYEHEVIPYFDDQLVAMLDRARRPGAYMR